MKNLIVKTALKEIVKDRYGLNCAGDVIDKAEEDFLVYLERACERTKENGAKTLQTKYL